MLKTIRRIWYLLGTSCKRKNGKRKRLGSFARNRNGVSSKESVPGKRRSGDGERWNAYSGNKRGVSGRRRKGQ